MRNEIAINHQMLRAAQNKAVIARFIGDSKMWLEANKAMKSAINIPWYRQMKEMLNQHKEQEKDDDSDSE